MRKISPKQYAESLYQAIKENKNADLNLFFDNFLKLVWQNKDWKRLAVIVNKFKEVYMSAEGFSEATVVSAHPLVAEQKNAIIDWLEEKSKTQVELSEDRDPFLLGGLIIKQGDMVLDASVKNHLHNLQTTLTK